MRKVNIYGQEFSVVNSHPDFWDSVERRAWEPETFRIFDCYVRDVNYVDLGAWIGPTALYASRLARYVWAYEPDPVAHEILLQNITRNKIPGITVSPVAVMNYSGEVNLGSESLGSSMTRMGCEENRFTVPCVSLYSQLTQIDDPIFIKMDVEGAETEILKDVALFEERRPDLYLSLHPHRWKEQHTFSEIFSLYNSRQYLGPRSVLLRNL